MKAIYYAVRYLLIFLKELTIANYEVVKLVLAPRLKIRPGFIAIPMDADSDFEVTCLANSITLTPGTITVHLPKERHVIVIHALDVADDPQAVRDAVKTALEANILKFTRAGDGK